MKGLPHKVLLVEVVIFLSKGPPQQLFLFHVATRPANGFFVISGTCAHAEELITRDQRRLFKFDIDSQWTHRDTPEVKYGTCKIPLWQRELPNGKSWYLASCVILECIYIMVNKEYWQWILFMGQFEHSWARRSCHWFSNLCWESINTQKGCCTGWISKLLPLNKIGAFQIHRNLSSHERWNTWNWLSSALND